MRGLPSAAGASLGALAAVLVLGGCGGTTQARSSGDGTLTVLAAASLTESFTELERRFEADHPGSEVRISFDSSATLARQAVEGAPADVLATADSVTMHRAVEAGAAAGEPEVFATNTMVLVVPAANPAGIEGFTDLDRPAVTFVACAESAPCGALARSLLDRHGIDHPPSSLEVDVKAVLSKVALDEADAGLVYRSDAVAAGSAVRTVPVPGSAEAVNSYLATTLAQAPEPRLARQWLELLTSPEGRRVLADHGFGPP